MKKLSAGLTAGLLVLAMTDGAQATLTTIGSVEYRTSNYNTQTYNLIWDNFDNDGKSVVWLDYTANARSWDGQQQWVGLLNDGTSLIASYTLIDGYSVDWGTNQWRLPDTVDGVFEYGINGTTTGGYNIVTSELGHLFYGELDNNGKYLSDGTTPSASGLTNVGPFEHIAEYAYWSGTEYATNTNSAWFFDFDDGLQGTGSKSYSNTDGDMFGFALALREGTVTYTEPDDDNGAAPVPEPATMLLFGTGLASLAGNRIRRKKKA